MVGVKHFSFVKVEVPSKVMVPLKGGFYSLPHPAGKKFEKLSYVLFVGSIGGKVHVSDYQIIGDFDSEEARVYTMVY